MPSFCERLQQFLLMQRGSSDRKIHRTALYVVCSAAAYLATDVQPSTSLLYRTGQAYCPPLEPSDEACWYRYGVKWTTSYLAPEEFDVYTDLFATGKSKTIEVLREHVIDESVAAVLAVLQKPMMATKISYGKLALEALEGMRFSLCAVEFSECYSSQIVAVDTLDTYCTFTHELLQVLSLPLPDHFCSLVLIPDHIQSIVSALMSKVLAMQEFIGPPGIPIQRTAVFYPGRYSPEGVCDNVPMSAFSNSDFSDGSDWIDDGGVVVPHLSIESILQRIQLKTGILSRWVVNLGAGDGLCGRGTECHDPANCLILEQNFHGLLVEGNASLAASIQSMFEQKKLADGKVTAHKRLNLVFVAAVAITPLNVPEIVLSRLPTLDIDLLKIDIDSVPHDDLLRSLLETGLRPKVVHTEFDLYFPPPVSFTPAYDDAPSIVYGNSPVLVGQHPSLARLDSVAKSFGYELLHVELRDAVWVRRDFIDAFPFAQQHDVYTKWLSGSFCHPRARKWGEAWRFGRYDFRAWADPSIPMEDRGRLMRAFLDRAFGPNAKWHLDLGISSTEAS